MSNYLEDGVAKALEFAFNYAQIDGNHHKMWVIDQMVRALTGCEMVEKETPRGNLKYMTQGESKEYLEWIYLFSHDDEGNTYTWDTGVAP